MEEEVKSLDELEVKSVEAPESSTEARPPEVKKEEKKVKMRAALSEVWTHFCKTDDEKLALCKKCGKSIKTSGNTTNLHKHLFIHGIVLTKRARATPSTSTSFVLHSPVISETIEVEITRDETALQGRKKMRGIKFRPAWCQQFKWLKRDDSPQGKMCTICRVKLSGNFYHIQRHASSDMHKKAESAAGNRIITKLSSPVRSDSPKTSPVKPHKILPCKSRKPPKSDRFKISNVKFRQAWCRKFKWLQQDDSPQGKMCIICGVHVSGNLFHIQRHAASDMHRKAKRKARKTSDLCGFIETDSTDSGSIKTIDMDKRAKLKSRKLSKLCSFIESDATESDSIKTSKPHKKLKHKARKTSKQGSFTESDSTDSDLSQSRRLMKQKVPKKERTEGKPMTLKNFLSQDNSNSTAFQTNQSFVEVHARQTSYEESAEIDYDHHTIKAFEKYFVEDSEQKIEYEDDTYVEDVTEVEYMEQEDNDESFESNNFLREEGSKNEKITMSILYLLCRDMHDLKFIKGKGFIRFMNEVAPYYSIPSTLYMQNKLYELYDTTLLFYRQRIEKAPCLSLTLDIWTNAKMERTCLGVTAHFLEGLKRINCNIATKELQAKPNASYLSSMLKSILKKWNIPSSKINCIISDNGATITTAAKSIVSEKCNLPCLLRSIETVVDTGLRTNDIKVIISKVRSILKWSQNYVINSDKLTSLYSQSKLLEESTKKFTVDMKWTSVYCMLERFLEVKSICLQLSLGDYTSPEMLTELEIAIIKEAKTILQPFECLTDECLNEDGGFITLSKVIPILNCLKIKLLAFDSSYDPIITLRESLITETDKKFSHFLGLECNSNAAIATLLDPRFKNIHFQYESSCNRAIQQLREFMRLEKQTKSEPMRQTKCDLWQYHRDLLVKQNQYRNIDKEDEIALYLAYPVSALKSSPLEDWEDMKNIFPNLYKQARKFLSIVASSSSIEDADEKRNSLTINHMEKMLFLRNVSENCFF